ncbi:hypothetical protein Tco_1353356 [Tanacetum coccineum]
MHHRSDGLTRDKKAIFKHLEKCIFHEGQVVDPSYIGDSHILEVFSTINLDCLLNINEQICLLFLLEFYKSFRITQNRDQTISITFIIKKQEIILPLAYFTKILHVSSEGACMYTVDWSFANLPKSLDSNPTYPTPLDDPILLNEMKHIFKKKWEVILSENVISLTGKKDHPNVYLVYMLYCLAIRNPFNLAYYMVKRMVGVIKNEKMVLSYGMLLTCLYRHVSTIQPCPLIDEFLTPYVMVPLTEGRAKRFMMDGKRPHPSTSSSSSS